jgi:simple sugar transport system ATP-binding protein
MAVDTSLLQATGLVKRYGHVQALRGADFTVGRGEVVALVGDNGAGKSTLVKCLSGAIQPDEGRILVEGQEVTLDSPVAAQHLGLETVYQDLALALDLDPAANLYLGREVKRRGLLGRLGVLDKRFMRLEAEHSFAALGVHLQDLSSATGNLSGGQRQSVAVARAIAWASKVVFLDEPTAALGVVQTKHVLDVIRKVRDKGISVVLISHNMPDVMSVADRIEVFRLGARVAQLRTAETSLEEIISAMTAGEPPQAAAARDERIAR